VLYLHRTEELPVLQRRFRRWACSFVLHPDRLSQA